MKSPLAPLLLFLASMGAAAALPQSTPLSADEPLRSRYVPEWSSAPVQRALTIDFDASLSDTDNGERLRQRVLSLQPGDRLQVGPGRWSVWSFFQVDLQGTAGAPIRIVASEGTVLTRPNAGQNAINFGSVTNSSTRYVLFRGFEVLGGSYGIRVQNAEHLWIDQCVVHGSSATGIGANSHNTSHLFVTRCDVSDTANTGEGIYLGGNNSSVVCRHAVIAQNHVHDTGGSQGDGIELKQGSYGCLIAENQVHGTNYPGILIYGADGNEPNIIESNVIWDTASNAFQVQGDAIVRNNLVIGGSGQALQSGAHQGLPQNLKIIGNTFISRGSTAFISSWQNKPGMVFANNVVYSETDESIHVNGGLSGVTVEGNVVLGPTWGAWNVPGFYDGNGLSDFVDLSFDGSRRDARPSASSALAGLARPLSEWRLDLTGARRPATPSVGALEPGTYARYVGVGSPRAPRIRASAPLSAGATSYTMQVEDLAPFQPVFVGFGGAAGGGTGGVLGQRPLPLTAGLADAQGRFLFTLSANDLPPSSGDTLNVLAGTRDMGSNGLVRWARRARVTRR